MVGGPRADIIPCDWGDSRQARWPRAARGCVDGRRWWWWREGGIRQLVLRRSRHDGGSRGGGECMARAEYERARGGPSCLVSRSYWAGKEALQAQELLLGGGGLKTRD